MSQPYTAETGKILSDLLEALTRNKRVDPAFLAELRQMMTAGELDDTTRISHAIAALEERADDMQD